MCETRGVAEGSMDTVFALSSGRGRAGVAVLRVSGPQAGAALDAVAGGRPAPRRATLRTLRDPRSGEPLDQALVLWFPGPASFTGEDVAELHVHGGHAVISAVTAALAALPGLRLARPGEFARRAFDNGRLDLTAVEGLADLIDAETQAQRRQALRQSEGGLGRLCESWRARLVEALALMEAGLDFADEADVPDGVYRQALAICRPLVAEIASHLDDRRRGERLRDGLRVVLAGAPNAGKSSLLNALAEREAAIVSAEAGTTRDVIEVHLDLDGYPVIVMDTAGLRAAAGGVEAEGIRRTLARAEEADVIVWLVDAVDPVWQPPPALAASRGDLLVAVNKIDLRRPEPARGVEVSLTLSARTGEGIAALTRLLGERAAKALDSGESLLITRARQRAELERARDALTRFLAGAREEPELRAEDLRQAAHALGRITGRVDVEDVLDRIFADFCIGK